MSNAPHVLRAITPGDIATAQRKLTEYIHRGQQRAVATQERVLRDVPTDYLAPTQNLYVEAGANGDAGKLALRLVGEGGTGTLAHVHRYALGQLAELCKMRMDYVDHLLSSGDWGRALLARNLEDGLRQGKADETYLVRKTAGEVRGVLSSKFRRIDARPILDMLIGEAQRAGAIVVDGTSSDIRTEMKFIVPRIMEPAPGEFMVFGFAWGTSDYGAGSNWIRAFAERLACFNGMTMEQTLRQVHVGRQLRAEDFAYSQRTLELDTRTAISATRDVARAMLSEARIEATSEVIRKANEEGIEPEKTLLGLKKKVTKTQSEAIAKAFNSPNVVELPAGNTMWRFSNAISLVARDTEDADDKLALERLAGDVLKAA